MTPEITIDADGTKRWHLNGALHRTDGPALEWVDGTKEWWVNGLRHRIDGPAAEHADGGRDWWVFGELHREDGPAVEGGYNRFWYLRNENFTFDKWLDRTPGLTEEEKVLYKLQYG
jgi:hypothetical protein